MPGLIVQLKIFYSTFNYRIYWRKFSMSRFVIEANNKPHFWPISPATVLEAFGEFTKKSKHTKDFIRLELRHTGTLRSRCEWNCSEGRNRNPQGAGILRRQENPQWAGILSQMWCPSRVATVLLVSAFVTLTLHFVWPLFKCQSLCRCTEVCFVSRLIFWTFTVTHFSSDRAEYCRGRSVRGPEWGPGAG